MDPTSVAAPLLSNGLPSTALRIAQAGNATAPAAGPGPEVLAALVAAATAIILLMVYTITLARRP